jgi:FtsZ-binding cell division protein ZapB
MEHFVLKESGKIHWIENMPDADYSKGCAIGCDDFSKAEREQMCQCYNDYGRDIQSAIDNAVEVSNQEETIQQVEWAYNQPKGGLNKSGKVYELQCRVSTDIFKTKALVTFDQPEERCHKARDCDRDVIKNGECDCDKDQPEEKEYIHDWQDQMTIAAGIEDISALQKEIKELKKDANLYVDTIQSLTEASAEKDQENTELKNRVKELLMFCEADGTVVNGFRTQEIIQQLKAIRESKEST